MAVNNRKWMLLYLVLTTSAWAEIDEMMEESIDTEVKLDEFDLEEVCGEVAQAKWNYHLDPSEQNLQRKIEEEQKYGDDQRNEAERMSHNLGLQLRSSELRRKIELLTKPGASLLGREDFNEMVLFSNRLEERKYTKYNICSENTIKDPCEMNLQDMKNALVKPYNIKVLHHIWKEYSAKWSDMGQNFSKILYFANDEATLNGAPNIQKYWENITELQEGYKKANSLWKRIQPLYKKLHNSISRLITKQHRMQNETISLAYLGSVTGADWTSIADMIYRSSNNQYQYIIGKLKEKELSGVSLYHATEIMAEKLGLGKLSPNFWNESRFDLSCPTKATSFCKEMRITTCKDPSWVEYLNAHEAMLQAHRQAVDQSFVFRENSHHSALYEAVSRLGSLLASTPKYLELQGILPSYGNELGEDIKYTLLILTALRTLPQLPYYLAADMWRLEVLKNNETDAKKLKNSWIKFRESMQMVSVPENADDWFQLLTDPYIVNNKPYLGKFIGIILEFQLLEYFMDGMDIELEDAVDAIGSNDNLKTLFETGFSRPWPSVLEDVIAVDYIDASPLLNFFSELEDALEEQIDSILPVATNIDEMTNDEATSAEAETETETETVTLAGIMLSDIQNQNVSVEIPSNTETDNKEAEKSGTGTILLFSITATIAVIVVVGFFVVGRKRFIRSHLYRQPPDQNTAA